MLIIHNTNSDRHKKETSLKEKRSKLLDSLVNLALIPRTTLHNIESRDKTLTFNLVGRRKSINDGKN